MSSIMGEGNFEDMQKFMGEQGVDLDEMNQMMESGNFEDMQKFMDEQNINFGQMSIYAGNAPGFEQSGSRGNV